MSSQAPQLLDKIAGFENLYRAFQMCSKGKRGTHEYQRFFHFYGEKLKLIEDELKATGQFEWGTYRDFFVHDPKQRLVMAAPFRDRIVHAAIHQVIEPIIDQTLGARTYACRLAKGNRGAVVRTLEQLRLMGKQRYCIKLDVKKYFYSVSHEVLLDKLQRTLPDDSIDRLIYGLVKSHPEFAPGCRGIPIGNLTSQLFANFYLSSVDRLACEKLNISFMNNEYEQHAYYIRYMDDMVILARDKKTALDVANALVQHAEDDLRLSIPFYKRVLLCHDPIPFLGFVLDHDGYRVLSRNERRFAKKLKRLGRQGAALSRRAQSIQSYEAWKNIIV